jgi:homopolymeric O-antigen transport system permease protein
MTLERSPSRLVRHGWTARFLERASLSYSLARHEVLGRYRGSALGLLWSLLTPLFMLAIYTFVFGTIFKARWNGTEASSSGETHSTAEFAIILFAGLIVFQLFAEVINRAPTLILSHATYVKKVVFPLEILPVVALGSALFHALISLAVLLTFSLFVHGSIPLTALLLPLVLAPFLVMILGLSWFLASLGVYVRDISQFLGTVVTALLFLSPVFFPASALPEHIRSFIFLNPLALPAEEARNVLIWGKAPDWHALGLYAIVALGVATLGRLWFEKMRKGFADVL